MMNATRKSTSGVTFPLMSCSVDLDDGRSNYGELSDVGKCDDRDGAGYLYQGRCSDPSEQMPDMSPGRRHRADAADDLRGDSSLGAAY